MPSPFPGMDPYLEAPHIWPDFHDHLASEVSAILNQTLPKPYYARLEMRPEVGILDFDEPPRRVVPDVAVVKPPRTVAATGEVALLETPRTELSQHLEVDASIDPIRHHFVEVRDPSQQHKLITLIEFVSPSNKRPGKDRDAYLEKQSELLASDVSLVEIDLLRGGDRLFASEGLRLWHRQRAAREDYVILVSKPWKRDKYDVYVASVREPLPVIGIPLRESEPPVSLDLQFAVSRAYDRGPYRRGAVDYSAPPSPPLHDDDATWAAELIRKVTRSPNHGSGNP